MKPINSERAQNGDFQKAPMETDGRCTAETMKENGRFLLHDIPDEPSPELRARTLSAMREMQTPMKQKPWARIFICAALFCMALVLMGAGVKVFDFVAFVPGMGVISADNRQVYILENTVNCSDYRIEAVSMVPASEEAYRGMWRVTVLINRTITAAEEPTMHLISGGRSYPLNADGESAMGSRFTGYAERIRAGEYTLSWQDENAVITMESVEKSRWADHVYPVSDGLTAIVMPLSRNSRYFVFDVIFEPQSENMRYWAEHSSSMEVYPSDFVVTDKYGQRHHISSIRSTECEIPESGTDSGLSRVLEYKSEQIISMSAIPAGDVVKIEIGGIVLVFNGMQDAVRPYRLTLSDPWNEVEGRQMPDRGVMMDTHGIRLAFDKMKTERMRNPNCLATTLSSQQIEFEFEENVANVYIALECIRADREDLPAKEWEACYQYGRSSGEYGVDFTSSMDYVIPHKDSKEENYPAAGHDAVIRLNCLRFILQGSWTIDFSTENRK